MNKPKISVIIVYENEENLYNCVQSAVQQSFSNIEVICVNNGSNDNSENIVKEQAGIIDRIRLISIPDKTDKETAKKAGISIAEGEYVIFIENNETLEADFIKNMYVNVQNENKTELKTKYLYRRTFLENDKELSNLIEDRVNAVFANYTGFIDEQKAKIRSEFDNFYKVNIENIKNSTYEILTRFNALEKEFYSKDWQYQEKINNYNNEQKTLIEDKLNYIYRDIQQVYDYINSEINKKGTEINSIYAEITKNYKYTEEFTQNKIEEAIQKEKNKETDKEEKLNNLEKEITLRYVNLKRMMDLQFSEIKEKLNGG